MDGCDAGRPSPGNRSRVRSKVHAALEFLGRSGSGKAHGAVAAQHVGYRLSQAVLSIITGGGKWVVMTIPADPLSQHLLLTAEKKFWRCVETGEPPSLFGVEPPRPRLEAIRTVDMSGSNAWAEFASLYRLTRPAALDHDRAKSE